MSHLTSKLEHITVYDFGIPLHAESQQSIKILFLCPQLWRSWRGIMLWYCLTICLSIHPFVCLSIIDVFSQEWYKRQDLEIFYQVSAWKTSTYTYIFFILSHALWPLMNFCIITIVIHVNIMSGARLMIFGIRVCVRCVDDLLKFSANSMSYYGSYGIFADFGILPSKSTLWKKFLENPFRYTKYLASTLCMRCMTWLTSVGWLFYVLCSCSSYASIWLAFYTTK